MKAVQQEFVWSDGNDTTKETSAVVPGTDLNASLPPLEQIDALPVSSRESGDSDQSAIVDRPDSLPIPRPQRQAVEAGVFGQTGAGPVEPDDDEVAAITEQHADELIILLFDGHAITDSIRSGCDPRTGRVPKTPEAQARLAEFLQNEERRLTNAYADGVAAYAEAFGDEAAGALDVWVRKAVADNGPTQGSYDPTHPWHYYHAGDNATPAPAEEIPADMDAAQFLDERLPKNPAKRLAKLREMLVSESQQLETDKRRYADIVERGAEALSRYDREIAHTSDAMARASALALKYRHVGLGLGRLAWIEAELRKFSADELYSASGTKNVRPS